MSRFVFTVFVDYCYASWKISRNVFGDAAMRREMLLMRFDVNFAGGKSRDIVSMKVNFAPLLLMRNLINVGHTFYILRSQLSRLCHDVQEAKLLL